MKSATRIRRNQVTRALALVETGCTKAKRYFLRNFPGHGSQDAAAIVLSGEVRRLHREAGVKL